MNKDKIFLFVFTFNSFVFSTIGYTSPQQEMIYDDGFGVFYESPMNNDKGLILYISNKNCFGTYRIANKELIIANGEINARGPDKVIPFGVTKFRIDCGPQQTLTLTRE